MSLESLKSEKNSYREELCEATSNLQGYQQKVDALNSLYDSMKKKKEEMKNLEQELRNVANESYVYWQGNVFNNRYGSNVKDELLVNGYGKLLDIIDNNLDEINNKRTYYENLIYESEGIIGKLHACINSVETYIQNWIN